MTAGLTTGFAILAFSSLYARMSEGAKESSSTPTMSYLHRRRGTVAVTQR